VRLPKKFNVPKSVSENSDSEENDALFALDTQIAIIKSYKRTVTFFGMYNPNTLSLLRTLISVLFT
jgi:hypothetical protein